VGTSLKVVGDNLEVGDNYPLLDGGNTFTGSNSFNTLAVSGYSIITGNVMIRPSDAKRVELYNVDSLTASSTHVMDSPNDFITKKYADSVSTAAAAGKLDARKEYGGTVSEYSHAADGGGYKFTTGTEASFVGADSGTGIFMYSKNPTNNVGSRVIVTPQAAYVLANTTQSTPAAGYEIPTKHYVDSVSAGSGVAPSWSAVTGKPFSVVGNGLHVSHDSLIADGGGGGAPAWGDVTGKPFTTVGANLTVTGDALTTSGLTTVQQLADTATAVRTWAGNTFEPKGNYVTGAALDTVRNFATGRMEYISFTNPNPPAGTRRDQRLYANIGCAVGGSGVSGAGRPNFKIHFSIQGARGKWGTDPAKQDYELLYGWENNGDYNSWRKLFWLGDGYGANESPIIDSVYIVPRGQYDPHSDIWVSWRYNDNYMHSIFVTDVHLTQNVDSAAVAQGKSYGGLTPDNRWIPTIFQQPDTIRPFAAVGGVGAQVSVTLTPVAKYAPAVTSSGAAFTQFDSNSFAVTGSKLGTVPPAWGDVTGKPFSALGSGLHVSNDTLIAEEAGAPAWGDVTGKPFTALGAHLKAANDSLTIDNVAVTDTGNTFAGVNTFLDTLKSTHVQAAGLETAGDAYIGGNLIVAGNTYLGNEGTDTIFADAPILMAEGYVPTSSRHVATKGYVDGLANRRRLGEAAWNWTMTRTAQSWEGAKFGDGVFILAGGYGDQSVGYIARSTDNGLTWVIQSTGRGKWQGVAYGNGVWLAVGGDTLVGRSTDNGLTWTTFPAPYRFLRSIDYGDGVWIACGGIDYSSYYLGKSTDNGQTWTELPSPGVLYNITAAGNGKWAAVGSNGKLLYTANNGASWTEKTLPGMSYRGVASNGAGVWCAVEYSAGYIARTADDWQTFSTTEIGGVNTGMGYGNGVFIVCRRGGFARSHDNGLTWTIEGFGGSNTWDDVAWGNDVYISAGNQGIGRYDDITIPSYLIATKAYADSVLGNRTVDWTDVQNKPFDEVGGGLIAEPDTVTGRGANAAKVLKLEDDDWDNDAHADQDNTFMGVNSFAYPVTGATPIDGRHFATKDYVDATAWGEIATRTLRIPHIDHTSNATTVGHGAWFASFPKGWDVWAQYWLPDTTLVTAYPESGYTVSDWLVNGVSTGMSGAQISFPITQYGDATLTPVLAPPPMFKYSVRAEPADAANVYLNDVENGSITAQQGTVSQIRLHTSGKYPFGNWYMNGVNVDWYCYTVEDTNWPYTWPIAENAELVYVKGNPITASFNTVAGTMEDGKPTTNPTINGAASATGPYNTVYSFKANIVDPANYIFSHWTRSAADGKGNLDTAGYTPDMQYNITDRGMYVANTFTAYTRPTAEYIKLHWTGLRYCCRIWVGDKVVDLSTKDTILRRADNLVVHLEYRHDSFPDNYPYNVMVADKNLQGTPYRSVFEFNTNDASLPFQTDISVYEWKSSLENMSKVIPSIMRTSKHANPADPDEIVSFSIDGADMAFQNKRYGGLYMPEMDKEYILPPLWFPSDKKANFEITGKTCKWNVHTDIELDVNGKNVNSSTCDFKLPDKVGGNAVNYVKVQVWQSAF
jgi:hypothetical protein